MPGKYPAAGWFIVNLPVTTQIAYSAGVELWGFPKYIAQIDTGFLSNGSSASLNGEFDVEMKPGHGPEVVGTPLIAWSVFNGQILRTLVSTRYRLKYGGARSVKLTLTGNGPTAGTLDQLGLDRIRPFLAFRTDTFQSQLPLGRPICPSSV